MTKLGIENLKDIPNGSTVMHRNKYYWLSKGLEGRIITNTEGRWTFVKNLKWKSFWVIFKARGTNV